VNKAKKSSRSKYVYRNVSLPSINRHDIWKKLNLLWYLFNKLLIKKYNIKINVRT
jgi:hypothetical protein